MRLAAAFTGTIQPQTTGPTLTVLGVEGRDVHLVHNRGGQAGQRGSVLPFVGVAVDDRVLERVGAGGNALGSWVQAAAHHRTSAPATEG